MEKAGLKVLPVRVPRSVRAQEAATQGQPITHYDPENPVSLAYRKIGEGLDRWLNGSKN
jgi:cellulose biosynthesis protein BcsQ